MNSQAIWQGVLGEIEVSIPPSSFSTWFKSTELDIISDNEVAVLSPNPFVLTQLEKRYYQRIADGLKRNGLAVSTIHFRPKKVATRRQRLNRDEPHSTATSPPIIKQVNK